MAPAASTPALTGTYGVSDNIDLDSDINIGNSDINIGKIRACDLLVSDLRS